MRTGMTSITQGVRQDIRDWLYTLVCTDYKVTTAVHPSYSVPTTMWPQQCILFGIVYRMTTVHLILYRI